ncbi:hypothetical protein GGX14DRAFT_320186, partial [Mycena pura]
AGNYHFIHPERKRLIPVINQTVQSTAETAELSGMGVRTVRRALRNQRIHGGVIPPQEVPMGRHRAANGLDKFYLECLVAEQSDRTLTELRDELRKGTGLDIDETTVSRILQRRGYTRKEVR